MKKRIIYLFVFLIILLNSCNKDDLPKGSVRDIEGNKYETVILGDQEWMVENLRTTKYRNGISLKAVTSGELWVKIDLGAYCNYNNESKITSDNGLLYNYYAVIDSNNIAPEGWHVSTRDDWERLIEFYGGQEEAGNKIKNDKNFNLKYSGFRSYEGNFIYRTKSADWWCTPGTSSQRGHVSVFYLFNHVSIYNSTDKSEGLSIRCVKDK